MCVILYQNVMGMYTISATEMYDICVIPEQNVLWMYKVSGTKMYDLCLILEQNVNLQYICYLNGAECCVNV